MQCRLDTVLLCCELYCVLVAEFAGEEVGGVVEA